MPQMRTHLDQRRNHCFRRFRNGNFHSRMSGLVSTLPILLSIILWGIPAVVDGFANNLVETKIGCMTDLSTEEVIMNNEVKPPEDSDFPKMHLVVLDNNDKHLETPYKYDPSVSTIRMAFLIPYSTSEFNEDLQFVVEVEGPTEDSKAAEFVAGGSIGCENNRRVSARHMDNNGLVVLKVNDPTAKLRVWAGWATGHSAVRLVPDLILEPGASATTTDQEVVQELEKEVQEMEEELHEEAKNNEMAASLEEEVEELGEELREEAFRNADKTRKEQEEKLLKMMDRGMQEAADPNSDKPPHGRLQRKRKNTLQTAEHIPGELADLHEKLGEKDLGLEIPLANNGKPKTSDTKSIQDKLKATNHNIDPQKDDGNAKKKHSLIDHTKSADQPSPEDYVMNDDGEEVYRNDDDLPEPEPLNDDYLPPEGDIANDDEITPKETKKRKHHRHHHHSKQEGVRRGGNIESALDASSHFLGCLFFTVCMGSIFFVFGKKRDKGRRDL